MEERNQDGMVGRKWKFHEVRKGQRHDSLIKWILSNRLVTTRQLVSESEF